MGCLFYMLTELIVSIINWSQSKWSEIIILVGVWLVEVFGLLVIQAEYCWLCKNLSPWSAGVSWFLNIYWIQILCQRSAETVPEATLIDVGPTTLAYANRATSYLSIQGLKAVTEQNLLFPMELALNCAISDVCIVVTRHSSQFLKSSVIHCMPVPHTRLFSCN